MGGETGLPPSQCALPLFCFSAQYKSRRPHVKLSCSLTATQMCILICAGLGPMWILATPKNVAAVAMVSNLFAFVLNKFTVKQEMRATCQWKFSHFGPHTHGRAACWDTASHSHFAGDLEILGVHVGENSVYLRKSNVCSK